MFLIGGVVIIIAMILATGLFEALADARTRRER
jgi:hypothetical protein